MLPAARLRFGCSVTLAWSVRALLLAVPPALIPASAWAQGAAPASASSQEASPPAAESAAPGPSAPVVPATGYGWSTPKRAPGKPAARPRAARAKQPSPDAILPGFETLPDGSTRLFVELSQPVPFEARVGNGEVTYILKGAHADRRNNYNPLVTVHFNTPVLSARLVPHGKDLWFVIELRAKVQPTAAMDPGEGSVATLRIQFPKGEYLPGRAGEAATSPSPSAAAPASGAPAKPGPTDPEL